MTTIFSKFRVACNKAKNVKPFQGQLLALDPGETTGWALFRSTSDDVYLERAGQYKTWPMKEWCVNHVTELVGLLAISPSKVVYEQYRVYEWKTDQHSWSDVPTLHIIGCIETLCIQKSIPYYNQTAQVAKNFCTDELLERWGLYTEGLKHARDAIRHGCYSLCFGND